MDIIKVKKSELLTIVENNRKKHKEEYLESSKAFRAKAAEVISNELDNIILGKDFSIQFNLMKPVSYLKEYDLAIKMLQMSIDDEVELDRSEFAQLVNDEWHWKSSFKLSQFSNASHYGVTGVSGSSGSHGSSGTSGNAPWYADIVFPEDDNGV
jgi:hypothetical protein